MAGVFYIAAAVLLFSQATNGASPCPRRWTHNAGTCYFVGDEKIQFREASQVCQMMKSRLLLVDNAAEEQFISNHFLPKLKSDLWNCGIGSNDEWKCVVDNATVAYLNWVQPRQHAVDSSESCIAMSFEQHGKMVETPCTTKQRFVCEKRVVSNNAPTLKGLVRPAVVRRSVEANINEDDIANIDASLSKIAKMLEVSPLVAEIAKGNMLEPGVERAYPYQYYPSSYYPSYSPYNSYNPYSYYPSYSPQLTSAGSQALSLTPFTQSLSLNNAYGLDTGLVGVSIAHSTNYAGNPLSSALNSNFAVNVGSPLFNKISFGTSINSANTQGRKKREFDSIEQLRQVEQLLNFESEAPSRLPSRAQMRLGWDAERQGHMIGSGRPNAFGMQFPNQEESRRRGHHGFETRPRNRGPNSGTFGSDRQPFQETQFPNQAGGVNPEMETEIDSTIIGSGRRPTFGTQYPSQVGGNPAVQGATTPNMGGGPRPSFGTQYPGQVDGNPVGEGATSPFISGSPRPSSGTQYPSQVDGNPSIQGTTQPIIGSGRRPSFGTQYPGQVDGNPSVQGITNPDLGSGGNYPSSGTQYPGQVGGNPSVQGMTNPNLGSGGNYPSSGTQYPGQVGGNPSVQGMTNPNLGSGGNYPSSGTQYPGQVGRNPGVQGPVSPGPIDSSVPAPGIPNVSGPFGRTPPAPIVPRRCLVSGMVNTGTGVSTGIMASAGPEGGAASGMSNVGNGGPAVGVMGSSGRGGTSAGSMVNTGDGGAIGGTMANVGPGGSSAQGMAHGGNRGSGKSSTNTAPNRASGSSLATAADGDVGGTMVNVDLDSAASGGIVTGKQGSGQTMIDVASNRAGGATAVAGHGTSGSTTANASPTDCAGVSMVGGPSPSGPIPSQQNTGFPGINPNPNPFGQSSGGWGWNAPIFRPQNY